MESRKSYHTRSERKIKKRWNNILINSLIFLGIILVVWLGTNLFIKSFNQADKSSSDQTNHVDTNDKAKVDNKEDEVSSSEEEETDKVEQSDTVESDGTNTETSDTSTSDSGESTAVEPSEGNGNWEAIGTEQNEPHVSNYDVGSVDWNEKMEAIAYATNIPTEQMELLWLGNNGDPNSAVGVIMTGKKEIDNPYVVYLDWVTNKGWKPTDVIRLQDLKVEKQEELKAKYLGEKQEE